MKSIQRLIHESLNYPNGKFPISLYNGVCATTGEPISEGVPISEINNDSFSNHADFFQYSDHVSVWCAWWYSGVKETHRNIILMGNKVYFPMISLNPKDEPPEEKPDKKARNSFYSLPPLKPSDRPSWLGVFRNLSKMPLETPCGGVLTVDPKVRLWPRTQLATVGNFGLYVHFPDYNLSEFVSFDLFKCLEICDFIISLLEQGYIKKTIANSLLGDAKKVKKDLISVLKLEKQLKELRSTKEFLPALLISGIKK